MSTRVPNVAGLFYPTNSKELGYYIEELLNKANDVKLPFDRLKAIIVPHAGYPYSGIVAASAFKAIAKIAEKIKNVILIGPSHRYTFDYIALSTYDAWETPLGSVKVNSSLGETLTKNKFIVADNKKFAQEHSQEVQIPFLQKVLPEFNLVSLCTGQSVNYTGTAESLLNCLNDETFLVISSDLSHYLSYELASQIDRKTINAILDKNINYFESSENVACGDEGIKILLSLAMQNNLKAKLIDYKNSGDVSDDKTQEVVGYAAIGFYC